LTDTSSSNALGLSQPGGGYRLGVTWVILIPVVLVLAVIGDRAARWCARWSRHGTERERHDGG
jgi:Na+/pantothenate symporter